MKAESPTPEVNPASEQLTEELAALKEQMTELEQRTKKGFAKVKSDFDKLPTTVQKEAPEDPPEKSAPVIDDDTLKQINESADEFEKLKTRLEELSEKQS